MNLRILEVAAAELGEAIAHYEMIEPGLGVRLKDEVKSVVAWISGHPELPPLRSKGYRRVNLKVFPYYIAYVIHADVISVVAIAHSARLPNYWIEDTGP